MKLKKMRILAVAALTVALAMPAYSAAPVKAKAKAAAKAKPKAAVKAVEVAAQVLTATAESSLKVLGDSTMHKWEAKATALEISASVAGGQASLLEAAQKGLLKDLKLTAQVAGLQSNESKKMDKNMHEAMEADKFTAITFVMSSYEVKGDEVTAKGALTIHGVSKDVELKGKIAAKDKALSVKGSFDMIMSEYGIKPPVMMLGTVRVADKLTIAYDFALEPKL